MGRRWPNNRRHYASWRSPFVSFQGVGTPGASTRPEQMRSPIEHTLIAPPTSIPLRQRSVPLAEDHFECRTSSRSFGIPARRRAPPVPNATTDRVAVKVTTSSATKSSRLSPLSPRGTRTNHPGIARSRVACSDEWEMRTGFGLVRAARHSGRGNPLLPTRHLPHEEPHGPGEILGGTGRARGQVGIRRVFAHVVEGETCAHGGQK